MLSLYSRSQQRVPGHQETASGRHEPLQRWEISFFCYLFILKAFMFNPASVSYISCLYLNDLKADELQKNAEVIKI